MNSNDKIPVVFECCRIVRGHSRSVICDLQRFNYCFLPNEMEHILKNCAGMSLGEIKALYNHQYDDIIQENYDFLEKEEYVFYTYNPEWFPAMSLEWDEPLPLTNAIIDVNPQNLFDFEKIWVELSDLACEHVQIRIYENMSIGKIDEIVSQIGTKRIISLEIITKYYNEIQEQDLLNFIYKQPRVISLILHTAPENRVVYQSEGQSNAVILIKEVIDGPFHCGKIDKSLFSLHISSFTESLHHNSCLNRKISIDLDGNIKNCPSMQESFGNIKNSTLQKAMEHPNFKKYWNFTKDHISTCKECEFRYICTDCRAYLETPDDPYSKPLKCGYDPYTAEWTEWSTNPLKQQPIDYYGLRKILD